MIIKRLRPPRYLATLIFCWGIVATFTAFVQNFAGLVACRLLLGFFEAGFFPGIMLYLTMFYNRKNIALRTAYFFATAAISGAAGGLVAYGVGNLDGTAGWRGWRWVLLIVGIPAVLTGFVVPFVLPNSPQDASFLTEQDKRNLILLREAEVGQTKAAQELHWDDVKAGMKDWTTYAFAICQYCSNNMLYSFSVFLPTIIKQTGTWSTPQVQALTIPVYGLGAITYIIMGRASDVTQIRGPFPIGGTLTAILGYGLLIANRSAGLSFAGCFLVAMGCYTAVGTPLAWLTSNNPRYGKRAFASGFQLTIGNSAGVAAPFIFSNATAPTYYPGYGATMGLLCVSMTLFTTLHFFWRRQNARRAAGKENWKFQGKTEEEIAEMGDKSPRFMAML
jgi:MFS family permease